MATESAFEKLAAKPLGYQLGVLFGILAVVGLLYYQLMYSSLDEEVQGAKAQQGKLQRKNKELRAREQEWTQMVNAQDELMKELAANEVSLPATAALPSFVGHLQDEAAVAGVTFRNWKRVNEVPAGGYVRVPVSVEVVGNFHQIMKYFYLLGKTKRIITVENFSLKPEKKSANDGDDLLEASFQATTFRQPDGAVSAVPVDANAANKEAPKDGAADPGAAKETPAGDGKASGIDRLKNPGGQ